MKIVGEELHVWAKNQKNDFERDLFGRSAFNRFYYAAFLTTRKMLGEFDNDWKKRPHRTIPGLLTGQVKSKAAKELELLAKRGVITQSHKSKTLQSLKIATNELSDLLKEAYNIRITADYNPEESISVGDKNNKVLSLDNCKLSTAEKWPDKANQFCKTIRVSWKEADLD